MSALALMMALLLSAERPYIAVVEKVAGAVGFFTEDGRQVGLVKIGSFPHEAVLSPDGRLLYISDNGVLWMTEDKPGTNTISVVDVSAMKRIGVADLGRFHRPHGIAFVPSPPRILATTERPFGLVMVDAVSLKVLRDYDVQGKSPHMVVPQPALDRAFVSDTDSGHVAVIQLQSGSVKLIPTGERPQGGVLSPDGKQLFVVNTGANTISIIDTVGLKVTGAIPCGKGPGRIALTPDGKTLIYNLQFEPAIGFADIASRKQIATAPLPGRPLSLTLSRDGRRAFTGLQEVDKVAFISVPERKVERVISLPPGSGPDPVIPLP